jgi:hypothetical protein
MSHSHPSRAVCRTGNESNEKSTRAPKWETATAWTIEALKYTGPDTFQKRPSFPRCMVALGILEVCRGLLTWTGLDRSDKLRDFGCPSTND